MSTQPKKAVILLSGGLDSSTVLAIAMRDGYECHALSFRYGQRHAVELAAAKRVAEAGGVANHIVIDIDLRKFGGSSLTSDDVDVPKSESVDDLDLEEGSIPSTYVPARNTIFLAFATGLAEVLGADAVFAGVNAVDYSGYPDCRPEFIEAFATAANLGTARGVAGDRLRFETPLIKMTKAQIIKTGLALGVDYSLTHSCYDPDDSGRSCGHCDSCLLRLRGFEEAGAVDPIAYVLP